MQVGKAKYGVGKKVFKIKDGNNVFRILPPIGKLAEAGKWSMYYRVEWGYKNSEGKNKPFLDCRKVNFQTKMVEIESAAHLRREALKKQKEQIVEAFRAGNATKEQVQEVTDLLKQYNLDSKHYLNVVDLNGEIGLLKIGHKAKLSLDSELKKLRETGVDPLSVDDGRFINFFRSNPETGFRDIVTTASVYKENVQAIVNGVEQILQQDKSHSMDEAFIARLEFEAFELSGMYPTPSAEEVGRLVTEGTPAVDEILGKSDDNSSEGGSTGGTSGSTNGSSDKTEGSVVTTPVDAKTNGPTADVASPVASAPIKAEHLTAAPATTKPATTKPVTAAPVATKASTPTTEDSEEVTDEEFLKSIGATT